MSDSRVVYARRSWWSLAVLCLVCARVFPRPSVSFLEYVCLNLAEMLTAVRARVSLCVMTRHRSRQSRRRGFLYHGAGLGVARGADVRLVVYGRNLVVMVAWHELTHQKPAFLLP